MNATKPAPALVERIVHEGQELVCVIRAELRPQHTQFLTDDNLAQQVGFVVYPRGGQIARHRHRPIERHLVGTSEVALAGLHAGEILEAEALPLRYAGFSSCFRREAGAAGRDTRGIFRVHQFDKVEMFSFVEPSKSAEEHERLLAIEERILTELEIPYRVVNVAVGDLGAPAAKKYDCEAWIPSQGRYRELTSCSNTTDYQARRLSCRHRAADGESPQAVHTLNGTAVAVGRTMIALIENRQEEGGGFSLPNILHSYGVPERIGSG